MGDKIRTSVSIKKHQVIGLLALLIIVALGVLLRLSPIFRGPITLKEFDVWAQYNNVQYLVDHGLDAYYHWTSTQFWYPEGKAMWYLRPGLTFTAAIAYYFLNAVGIHATVYEVCFYYPAVVGGIEIIMMYFLGKEVLDSRTGLLAAFFLAFNPGHLQRSTAGFFDNEALGVLAAILFFYFYIKAVKTGKFTHAVATGLSMGLLCLSWGAAQYPLLLVPLIGIILILSNRFDYKAFMVSELSLGIALVASTLQPHRVSMLALTISEPEFVVPLIFMIVGFLVYWFTTQKVIHPRFYETVLKIAKWGAIPAIVVGAVLLWGFPSLLPEFSGRALSIINPFVRSTMAVVSSVGEHMPSAWSVFYYNTLLPIFLIPVGIFFALKRLQHSDIALIVFIITVYFFTGSMVRIIMLFAPVAAIVGAYGLSSVLNYFGNIGRKKVILSRRRKRQAKSMMGPEDAVVVFVVVGILMIAQVVQTTQLAAEQMSYSELIIGGQYQDWPEALTWMRTNLAATTVVASWWDYGYWITVIGNVTSINDNGTDNATRMGLTGMAMMQTDELESAKIFRILHADYVLVQWGFLVNGLGGDEGKWPWMVRICNEHTTEYSNMGLRVTSGSGAWKDNSVFDYEEYMNSTSNAYEDKWFQSQLAKMMFYKEPTSYSSAKDSLGAYFALQVAGGTTQEGTQDPRKTDNGATWASMIPENGEYSFKAFTPAYFSSNRIVKIFKMDYTALDCNVNVSAPEVYSNGSGTVDVTNTGLHPLSLGNITLDSETDNGTKFTLSNLETVSSSGTETFAPGETVTAWFDAGQDLVEGRVVTVTPTLLGIGQDGQEFDFTKESSESVIKMMPTPQMKIDRSRSVWLAHETIDLTIENTGSVPVLINEVLVDGSAVDFQPKSGSQLVLPEKSVVMACNATLLERILKPLTITVNTIEGASDTITLANNTLNRKISILPENYTTLAEGIAKIDQPTNRGYIPVIPSQTVAWDNKSVEIVVKNTGTEQLALQGVFLCNGTFDDPDYLSKCKSVEFATNYGGYLLSPGETKKINCSLSEVGELVPNSDVSIFVTAITTGSYGKIIATDAGVIKVIDTDPQIQLLGDRNAPDADDYGVVANANETVSYIVKNVGDDLVTLESVSLNGTGFSMTEGTFYKYNADGTRYVAPSYSLDVQEVGTFVVDVGNIGTNSIRLNETTVCNLGATNGLFAISNITVTAKVSPEVSLSISTDSSLTNCTISTDPDFVFVTVTNDGANSVTLNALLVNGTSFDILPANMTSGTLLIATGASATFKINITSLSPTAGNYLKLEVLCKEGRLWTTAPLAIT